MPAHAQDTLDDQRQVSPALVDLLIDEHLRDTLPRLQRLWCYYRNALAEPRDDGASSGPPA